MFHFLPAVSCSPFVRLFYFAAKKNMHTLTLFDLNFVSLLCIKMSSPNGLTRPSNTTDTGLTRCQNSKNKDTDQNKKLNIDINNKQY